MTLKAFYPFLIKSASPRVTPTELSKLFSHFCSPDELTGADALAAALGKDTCDLEGMDEKLAGCLKDMQTRVKDLEQALLGGGSCKQLAKKRSLHTHVF